MALRGGRRLIDTVGKGEQPPLSIHHARLGPRAADIQTKITLGFHLPPSPYFGFRADLWNRVTGRAVFKAAEKRL